MTTAKEWGELLASKLTKDKLVGLREFLNVDNHDEFFDVITNEAIKVAPDAYFAQSDAAYNNTPITDEGVRALYADHVDEAFELDEVCGRCNLEWGVHDGISCKDDVDQLLGTTFIPAGNE